jgi:hypothetical protein
MADTNDSAAKIQRLKIELDRDGFAANQAILLDKSLERISFTLENRTADQAHHGLVGLVARSDAYYSEMNGKLVTVRPTGKWDYPLHADPDLGQNPSAVQITGERSKR